MILKYFVEDNLCEIPFLKELDKHLLKYRDIVNNYNFYVFSVKHLHTPPVYVDNKSIIIFLSDEHNSVPPYISNAKYIFKTGVSKENTINYPNLIPFPLGYTKYFKPKNTNLHIKDRPIDVFFAGQVITQDRSQMLQELLKCKASLTNLNIVHNVSPEFLSGFKGDVYTDLMYNSKICLCPGGTTITETFRYYEAFQAGCVVFTKNYLPKTWLYEKTPAVQLEDWNQLEEAIKMFLSDGERMNRYYVRTLYTQQEKYCAQSVASFITSKLV